MRKFLAALVIACWTFSLLLLLDFGCEAIADGWSHPFWNRKFDLADAFSPVGYNFIILPLATGVLVYKLEAPPIWAIIPSIISIMICTAALPVLTMHFQLNGQREVTLARHLCNAGMAGMAILLVMREYRRPMLAGEDTGVEL